MEVGWGQETSLTSSTKTKVELDMSMDNYDIHKEPEPVLFFLEVYKFILKYCKILKSIVTRNGSIII